MGNIILSAAQPTGTLHLGNYLGAIRHWVDLQNSSSGTNLFCIADLHAITIPQDPKELSQSILNTTAMYMACGINETESIIFNQSKVRAHAELHWILSSLTPMGWLNVMTQYKDKKDLNNNLGLYSYPVLMAADILLYKTNQVPVGNDQTQHLQLVRDVAGAFNRQYNTDYFNLPEPIITKDASRIMSLRDGTKKMSKSDPSDYSRINLTDDPDLIRLKIKKAVADEAGRKNLETIWFALGGSNDIPVNNEPFKNLLAEQIINHLKPIQEGYDQIVSDRAYLLRVLKNGSIAASDIANNTIKEVKDIIGLI